MRLAARGRIARPAPRRRADAFARAAGARNGHSGIYTLHPHPRPLHLYPLRLYGFPTDLRSSTATSTGAKLVAIEGVPIDEVVARVRPLITRDNEWSFRECVLNDLVCAEVLRGLGITKQ